MAGDDQVACAGVGWSWESAGQCPAAATASGEAAPGIRSGCHGSLDEDMVV